MKSSLSAGEFIYSILTSDQTVSGLVTKVFPVVVDSATLPYVAYRRASLDHNPTKAGLPGADTINIDVYCYAATYSASVTLAEAVREALDYNSTEVNGMRMRSCYLTNASEGYEDDAFVQMLTFTIKI